MPSQLTKIQIQSTSWHPRGDQVRLLVKLGWGPWSSIAWKSKHPRYINPYENGLMIIPNVHNCFTSLTLQNSSGNFLHRYPRLRFGVKACSLHPSMASTRMVGSCKGSNPGSLNLVLYNIENIHMYVYVNLCN